MSINSMLSDQDKLNISYKRSSIVGDEIVTPYELKNSRRFFFLVIYYSILFTSIAGLVYTAYFNPLFAVLALSLGYIFDNLSFGCGHLELHTEFIEVAEKNMNTLCHNSFIHHYRNKYIFHEKWLETRISYFIDPKTQFSFKTVFKLIVILCILFLLSYFVQPELAIAWYMAQSIPALIQSTIHEWYHCPQEKRKSFYSTPAFLFFTLLEKVSLASTSGHAIHHQQNLNNLYHVHRWLDLYLPFGEVQPEKFWKKALTLYKPGQTHMNNYAKYGAPFKFMIAYRFTALLAITVLFYIIV